MSLPRASVARCAGVWLVIGLGCALLLLSLRDDLRRAARLLADALLVVGPVGEELGRGGVADVRFDVLLTSSAALALSACAVWFWLVTTVVALEAVRGRSPRIPGAPGLPLDCPTAVRRWLLAACGVALAGGLAGTAHAGAAAAGSSGALHAGLDVSLDTGLDTGLAGAGWASAAAERRESAGSTTTPLSGLPLPDRAVAASTPGTPGRRADAPRREATAEPGPRDRVHRGLVVRHDDTLWDLAAGQLADTATGSAATDSAATDSAATDRAIDRGWRDLYAANRAVIGPDPDLILPGTWLSVPPSLSPSPDTPPPIPTTPDPTTPDPDTDRP